MYTDKEISFMDWIEPYTGFIYQVCQSYVGTNELYLHDIKQEVIMVLWREYATYGTSRHNKNFTEESWVKVMVINAARKVAYKYRSKMSVLLSTMEEVSLDLNEEESQLHSHVEMLMEKLKPQDRRLVLYWMEQYSYSQIAEIEKMSVTAVGTRMSRIFAQLRSIATQK